MNVIHDLREMVREHSPGGQMYVMHKSQGNEMRSIEVAVAAARVLGMAEAAEVCEDPRVQLLWLDAYRDLLSSAKDYAEESEAWYPIGYPVTVEIVMQAIGYEDPKAKARELLGGKRGLMNFYNGWKSETTIPGTNRKKIVLDSTAVLDALERAGKLYAGERTRVEDKLKSLFGG